MVSVLPVRVGFYLQNSRGQSTVHMIMVISIGNVINGKNQTFYPAAFTAGAHSFDYCSVIKLTKYIKLDAFHIFKMSFALYQQTFM